MLKRLFLAALLALAPIGAAHAASDAAVVVSACGTPPTTYVPGQVQSQTVDVNGRLCGAAVTSGGGAVTPGTYIGDTVIQGSALAVDGIAPVTVGIGASAVVVKASPGNLYGAYGTNPTAGLLYLFVVNSTAAPTNGTLGVGTASGQIQDCLPVQPTTTSSVNYQSGPGEIFTVGISLAWSSTACPTLTLATGGILHGSAK